VQANVTIYHRSQITEKEGKRGRQITEREKERRGPKENRQANVKTDHRSQITGDQNRSERKGEEAKSEEAGAKRERDPKKKRERECECDSEGDPDRRTYLFCLFEPEPFRFGLSPGDAPP